MQDIIQNILFGLVTGSVLAIGSAGFAMIRQTEGFLHLAHGQYMALGAFLGFVFVSDLGLGLLLGGALVALVIGAVGAVLALVVFRPVRSKGTVVLLFSSIGLAYVVYAVMIAVFGPEIRTYPVDFGHRFDFGSVSITVLELGIIALALATVVSLHVFLTMTRLGTSIRAVASNPELARVRGVPVERVSSTVWFIASALAGVAGVLLGVLSSVTLELGWTAILLILASTVVGGLGRIYGVMAAALLLGLAMDLSSLVVPTSYRTAVAFGVLVLVLLIKPEGIFSIKTRREQVA
jgi:neutral amino acid transport system permease protein